MGNKRLPVEVVPDLKSVVIASGREHLVILSRISTRAASRESRRGKTDLLKPGIVSLRGQKVLADIIWAYLLLILPRSQYGQDFRLEIEQLMSAGYSDSQ